MLDLATHKSDSERALMEGFFDLGPYCYRCVVEFNFNFNFWVTGTEEQRVVGFPFYSK